MPKVVTFSVFLPLSIELLSGLRHRAAAPGSSAALAIIFFIRFLLGETDVSPTVAIAGLVLA